MNFNISKVKAVNSVTSRWNEIWHRVWFACGCRTINDATGKVQAIHFCLNPHRNNVDSFKEQSR